MGPKKPPPAGSDSGLRPPQGQSRFFGPINPILHLSFIQIQRIEFFLSTKLFSTKDRRRENKPPPAGSDFGLRPSQGQSRFLIPYHSFSILWIQNQKHKHFLFLRILFFPKGRRREKKPPPAGSDSGLRPSQGISRVWANRGAERRMGATHHLVLNVRFRESKSTVRVKSVFRHHPFPSLP